jgi:hypothetical protein
MAQLLQIFGGFGTGRNINTAGKQAASPVSVAGTHVTLRNNAGAHRHALGAVQQSGQSESAYKPSRKILKATHNSRGRVSGVNCVYAGAMRDSR